MASAEHYQKQLGIRLNRDKIKLWEPPYTNKDGSKGEIPQELTAKYAADLSISESYVHTLLENLRNHALQKLAERERFQKSGLATLKVKVAGSKLNIGSKIIPIEIDLNCRGTLLKNEISKELDQPADHLKLICSGKVVSEELTLREQNIKNGSQLMVLCLSLSELEAQARDKQLAQLQETRHAAELLSKRAEKDDDVEGMDVQIADQSGKPLQLPAAEKKALTLAMTLHEKGRQAIKRKDITMALPLLLEADKEFQQCSSAILQSVDNYAVLCLDIVWCYLCLKNVDDLPDAEERLKKSEIFFQRSYGSDLQRLVAVKGSSGEELALFMRLHLLQGIVAFHQHKMEEARSKLAKAESELQRLTVDEDKITTVMSVGFSEGEARLGLRACDGNVQNAVSHIIKRREEKKENAKKIKEERRRKRLAKSLGKTARGDQVNVNNYEMLLRMGYPRGASAEALKQSNNDVSLALEVLQTHPEILSLPDPEDRTMPDISDDAIAQIAAMGFDPEMARRALYQSRADIEKAIEIIMGSGGILPPLPEFPSTSSGSSGSASSPSSDSSPEKMREEKEAIEKLVSDLPTEEEDYLDITLTDEAEFLQEYKSLLESMGS